MIKPIISLPYRNLKILNSKSERILQCHPEPKAKGLNEILHFVQNDSKAVSSGFKKLGFRYCLGFSAWDLGFSRAVARIMLILFSLICVSSVESEQVVTEVTTSTTVVVNEEVVKDTLIYPENLIEITVYEEPDLSLVARVSPEGMITYPLLGQLKVDSLTVTELEKKLTQALAEDYMVNPQVRIAVKEFSKITILGQVVKPGVYDLHRRLKVTEAIALAGGLTSIADANRMRIARVENDGKEKTIFVRFRDILKKGDKSQDVLLQPKDMIIVPETRF
jgi:polysaccharide export outer membrane protein